MCNNDFTSLKQVINKNTEYPVGHPEIIFQPEDTNIQIYFGIAKVTILPPEKLFHSVLPLRENDNRYVEPVYNSRWKNQYYNALGFAVTATHEKRTSIRDLNLPRIQTPAGNLMTNHKRGLNFLEQEI